jgi:choline kinase
MGEGFVCCYSDTLFTGEVLRRVLAQAGDIVLSVDTKWLGRYEHRTQHPPDDAEKVMAHNGCVTRIHRAILPFEAYGEYTGIAKLTPTGAAQLRRFYHEARSKLAESLFVKPRRSKKPI